MDVRKEVGGPCPGEHVPEVVRAHTDCRIVAADFARSPAVGWAFWPVGQRAPMRRALWSLWETPSDPRAFPKDLVGASARPQVRQDPQAVRASVIASPHLVAHFLLAASRLCLLADSHPWPYRHGHRRGRERPPQRGPPWAAAGRPHRGSLPPSPPPHCRGRPHRLSSFISPVGAGLRQPGPGEAAGIAGYAIPRGRAATSRTASHG
jgi:hypothetical protein